MKQDRGQMAACASEAWQKIWNASIDWGFRYDFEIYDGRSQDWNKAKIDIYLSVKST